MTRLGGDVFSERTDDFDVRDTDIFIANYQAIRDYVGTEITLYAQGDDTRGDGGEHFFQKLTGEAAGFFVDDDEFTLRPTGGDGSIGWIRSSLIAKSPFKADSLIAASLLSHTNYDRVETASYNGGWAATVAGPKGGSVYNSDGTTGAVSTIYPNRNGFFDALGKGFRLSGLSFNAAQFGTVGDGAVVDIVALQAAIDTAPEIILNAGEVYLCNADLSLNANNVLIGEGTLKFTDNFGIDCNNADGFKLIRIRVNGSNGATQAGVFIHNTTARWLAQDVIVTNMQWGYYTTNTWIGEIRGGVIGATNKYGIYMTNGTGNNSKGTPFGVNNIISLTGNLELAASVVCLQAGDNTTNGSTSDHTKNLVVEPSVNLEGLGIELVFENNFRSSFGGYYEGGTKGIVSGGTFNSNIDIDKCAFWSDGTHFNPAIDLTAIAANQLQNITITNTRGSQLIKGISANNSTLRNLTLNNNNVFFDLSVDGVHRFTHVDYGMNSDFGAMLPFYIAVDGNFTLTARESGRVFESKAFLATRTITLPPAKIGMQYGFVNTTSIGANMLVDPNNQPGTHSGGNNVAVLVDSTQSWSINEHVGETLNNTTDGSTTTITSNTATTITGILSGGTDNDWDSGDSYEIPELYRGQVAGKYKSVTGAGSTLHIYCLEDGIWDIKTLFGTVTDEP